MENQDFKSLAKIIKTQNVLEKLEIDFPEYKALIGIKRTNMQIESLISLRSF